MHWVFCETRKQNHEATIEFNRVSLKKLLENGKFKKISPVTAVGVNLLTLDQRRNLGIHERFREDVAFPLLQKGRVSLTKLLYFRHSTFISYPSYNEVRMKCFRRFG